MTSLPSFTVIIPARLASSRLPNKMLADLGGKPLVVRTALQAARSKATRVVVAADDESIMRACQAHGIDAILTDKHHPTGTDRLAQAAKTLGLADNAIVVNVQGDEPLINPQLIDLVAAQLAQDARASIATAAHPIETIEEIFNPNIVKVVLNHQAQALYFSRAPIPFERDSYDLACLSLKAGTQPSQKPLRHIGIYAYRAAFLNAFPGLAQAPIELAESLEQLRALYFGYTISVLTWHEAAKPGVDTLDDLIKVRQFFS